MLTTVVNIVMSLVWLIAALIAHYSKQDALATYLAINVLLLWVAPRLSWGLTLISASIFLYIHPFLGDEASLVLVLVGACAGIGLCVSQFRGGGHGKGGKK